VCIGGHGELVLHRISWELESTWIRRVDPRLGSIHGIALRGRHGHSKMSALSAAMSGMDGHGVLAEVLAKFHHRSAGGLAGDLGERIVRKIEGVGGHIHCHGVDSGGNVVFVFFAVCAEPGGKATARKNDRGCKSVFSSFRHILGSSESPKASK
jgi:hypothetical protein